MLVLLRVISGVKGHCVCRVSKILNNCSQDCWQVERLASFSWLATLPQLAQPYLCDKYIPSLGAT